jgi:hypothetical protein
MKVSPLQRGQPLPNFTFLDDRGFATRQRVRAAFAGNQPNTLAEFRWIP